MSLSKHRWTMRIGAVAAALALAVVGSIGQSISGAHAGAISHTPFLYEDGQADGSTAQFSTVGGQYALSTNNTIPYFSGSFSSGGSTYQYQMVGSLSKATTIPYYIIPVKFVFDPADLTNPANSNVRDATGDVQNVINSPVFQGATAANGCSTTAPQYGTSEQAATFTGLNVKACVQQVFPTVTVNVPVNQAAQVRSVSARVDAKWFASLENKLDNQFQVPANAVPLVLVHNTFLYTNNNWHDCCILGWHGAANVTANAAASGNVSGNGNQPVQTFMFASYNSYGLFRMYDANGNIITAPIADIHALSHEVGEWLNDPFVHNFAPAWSVPFEPQYGCSGILEVGDPLVGYSPNFASTGWHPQDLILAPWFMRPSTAPANGYTYPDNASYLAGLGATGMNNSSPGC